MELGRTVRAARWGGDVFVAVGQRSEVKGEDVFREVGEVGGDDVGVKGDGFDPGFDEGGAHKDDLAAREQRTQRGAVADAADGSAVGVAKENVDDMTCW